MSIENISERLERTEDYLKQRLSAYKDVMPVKWWNSVTLLEIYWEWIDYLVKESLKKRSDLLKKWQNFLLERNTDAIADLLIGFFEAKRRYGRDLERGEDKRDWFALCKNYCKKNGWREDEDLLHSLFSSYSGAERRIYRKVEKGKLLADTSNSLLKTIALTKAEMVKKEENKKKKAEEKLKKEEEKKKRKEERARKAEENRSKKAQKKKSKGENSIDQEFDENTEDDEKEVDPDYPKAPEGWRDPVDPLVKGPSILADEVDVVTTKVEETEIQVKNDTKKEKKKDSDQLYIPFEFED